MDIGLMVEGQFGLTWDRWSHILGLVDRLGFPSLFRSDHYFIGRQQDSLEAFLSFVLAARETTNVRFGPMVTPVTFREPVNVGRMAAQIDLLSGGRFVMGLGAGWNEAEHRVYGLDFYTRPERFDRLEEAIQLIQQMWRSSDVTFNGRFYQTQGINCLPRREDGSPPILIGGTGERRTLRLVAEYAEEWNSVNLTPETYIRKRDILEKHCEAIGRDPTTIKHSMMTFGMSGSTEAELNRSIKKAMEFMGQLPQSGERIPSTEEFIKTSRARGLIIGTTEEVIQQLGALGELGMAEVQFQHMDLDSDEFPEYLASDIMPKVARI